MSLPFVRAPWRVLTLVIAVCASAATLAGPVVAGAHGRTTATTATTYTRFWSCAGLSFYPGDSDTTYQNDGTVQRRTNTFAGSGVFRCAAPLPNGAVITKVRFTLREWDNLGLGRVTSCSLMRSGLTIGTASQFVEMAGVQIAGTLGAQSPEIFRPVDTTISYPAVDNSRYAYWLECGLGGTDGIYGADVTYTITAVKG